MVQVHKAWLRVRFQRSGKWSPFLQVYIHEFPSGECEAEIHGKPKPIVTEARDYFGNTRKYVRVPRFLHNSAFCIGHRDKIFDLLKEKIHAIAPDIALTDVIINYHEGVLNGPSQKQCAPDNAR
jgi:hypothetical protein